MLARLALPRQASHPRSLGRPDPWAATAVLTVLALLFVALFGERLAPHEPIYFVVEHGRDPRPYDPGVVFPFGSDVLGRDLFSVVIAGARTTLTIVLLGGLARVASGVFVAAIGNYVRPLRFLTEATAEFVSAIPATIVALVIVKVLVRADTSVAVFVGSLLVIGWAGPYRVIRAELDRLASAPFTQGARTIGVGRWRLFWRHHVPHLVPVLAVNLSQQVVASLVLVAELGVLGTFVGTTRTINIEESLQRVVTGPVSFAQIADPPEWGGLLASARTIESLWTTRWLIVVPGIAFAVTAVAVALLGYALSRRYARRELVNDLRGAGAGLFAVSVVVLVALSAVVPERYAAARDWATAARAQLRPSPDVAEGFASAGLRPIGSSFEVKRESVSIVRRAPARVTVAGRTLDEESSREDNHPLDSRNVQALIYSGTGGGVVEGPLVYVGRGISHEDTPVPLTPPLNVSVAPPLGTLIKDYPDDYAGVDVRGKIALVVRFIGVATRPSTSRSIRNIDGAAVDEAAASAIKRGATAVILIDPALRFYTDTIEPVTYGLGGVRGGPNPYLRLERESPATSVNGVPVIAVSPTAAQPWLTPFGIDLNPFTRYDAFREYNFTASAARDLGISARVEVPLERRTVASSSFVGEVPTSSSDTPRVLVWTQRHISDAPTADVFAAVAASVGRRDVPFIFVDFDGYGDRTANLESVKEVLASRHIALVIVVDHLAGTALRFTTPYGELIPAFDLYADRAGARHETTRTTATLSQLSEIAPFIELRTIHVTGDGKPGDLRADTAALLGYIAGRISLGAEELPR
jgi:peptide/nickel transport system permease protein